jgi:Outer membrane protein beta-barrel domain
LLFVSASAADAQFASPIRFNVHAGAAVPVGSFGDPLPSGGGADLGFRIGAGLELRPPLSPVGLRFDGAYDRLGIEGSDLDWTIWSITGNAVLSPAVSPLYFIGGIGFYSTDITGAGTTSDAVTDFGFNIGAGFSLPLTGFSTFIEGRFHSINTDGDNINYIPIVFGIRF